MAYKLQLVDTTNGLNFNTRYENLAKKKKPEIESTAPNGKSVKERTTFQGKPLMPGDTRRQWVDDDGNVYSKGELTFK